MESFSVEIEEGRGRIAATVVFRGCLVVVNGKESEGPDGGFHLRCLLRAYTHFGGGSRVEEEQYESFFLKTWLFWHKSMEGNGVWF